MGVDYYKLLGVDRNANNDDLKEAYKKLATKWQPDNYPDHKKEAEAKFKKVSEAYEVLSDPHKRRVYDQYGEEGLKLQMPQPDAGGRGGEGPTAFRINSRNSDDIFSEFFGFSSPLGGVGGGGSGGGTRGSRSPGVIFGDDMFSSFGAGGGGSMGNGGGLKKAPPIENRLPCTLEELYKGTTKKMKISREIVDINGNTIQVEEFLTIHVKCGWKKGTKITFPEKGNVQQNVKPSDVVFIVDEKPHSVFTRDGNDLIVTQTVPLGEALKGYTVRLTSLDGRSLNIPINNVIHPNYEETVPREGMPIQNDPSNRGNLIIKFNIKFPTRLTAEQKAGIKF